MILLLVGTTTTMEQTVLFVVLRIDPLPVILQSQQATDNAIEQYIRSHPEVIEQSLQALGGETEEEEKAANKGGARGKAE